MLGVEGSGFRAEVANSLRLIALFVIIVVD